MDRVTLDLTVAESAAQAAPRTWITAAGTLAAMPTVSTDQGVRIEVGFAGDPERPTPAPFGRPAWRACVTAGLHRDGLDVEHIVVSGGRATITVTIDPSADHDHGPVFAAAVHFAVLRHYRRLAAEASRAAQAAVRTALDHGAVVEDLRAAGLTPDTTLNRYLRSA